MWMGRHNRHNHKTTHTHGPLPRLEREDQADGRLVALDRKRIVAIRRVLHPLAHRILRPRGILRSPQLQVSPTLLPCPPRTHAPKQPRVLTYAVRLLHTLESWECRARTAASSACCMWHAAPRPARDDAVPSCGRAHTGSRRAGCRAATRSDPRFRPQGRQRGRLQGSRRKRPRPQGHFSSRARNRG